MYTAVRVHTAVPVLVQGGRYKVDLRRSITVTLSIRVFEICFFWDGPAWVAFTSARARQFYYAN